MEEEAVSDERVIISTKPGVSSALVTLAGLQHLMMKQTVTKDDKAQDASGIGGDDNNEALPHRWCHHVGDGVISSFKVCRETASLVNARRGWCRFRGEDRKWKSNVLVVPGRAL